MIFLFTRDRTMSSLYLAAVLRAACGECLMNITKSFKNFTRRY